MKVNTKLMTESDLDEPARRKKLGFWHYVKTSLAAAVGVQSNQNRELDFSQSSIIPYVITGVVFTTLFVLTLIFVVSLIV